VVVVAVLMLTGPAFGSEWSGRASGGGSVSSRRRQSDNGGRAHRSRNRLGVCVHSCARQQKRTQNTKATCDRRRHQGLYDGEEK
jgi:hypothetical protein